jgi:hypothetical protein
VSWRGLGDVPLGGEVDGGLGVEVPDEVEVTIGVDAPVVAFVAPAKAQASTGNGQTGFFSGGWSADLGAGGLGDDLTAKKGGTAGSNEVEKVFVIYGRGTLPQ